MCDYFISQEQYKRMMDRVIPKDGRNIDPKSNLIVHGTLDSNIILELKSIMNKLDERSNH